MTETALVQLNVVKVKYCAFKDKVDIYFFFKNGTTFNL